MHSHIRYMKKKKDIVLAQFESIQYFTIKGMAVENKVCWLFSRLLDVTA